MGTTGGTGPIGDYVGSVLELPVTVQTPCGPPEEFYFLPAGRTCQEVCGIEPVVCDNIAGGALRGAGQRQRHCRAVTRC